MKILIIDDHPLTVNIYEDIITNLYGKGVKIYKAYDCESAYNSLKVSELQKDYFDMIITDYRLPSFCNGQLYVGTDIIAFARNISPNIQSIVITAHSEILTLYEIIKKCKPDGLVTKSELSADTLGQIIEAIRKGSTFYSDTVKSCIKQVWEKEIIVDDFNRDILRYLCKGYKINELEEVINLSESAIRKRLTKIRTSFNVKDERELARTIYNNNYL